MRLSLQHNARQREIIRAQKGRPSWAGAFKVSALSPWPQTAAVQLLYSRDKFRTMSMVIAEAMLTGVVGDVTYFTVYYEYRASQLTVPLRNIRGDQLAYVFLYCAHDFIHRPLLCMPMQVRHSYRIQAGARFTALEDLCE